MRSQTPPKHLQTPQTTNTLLLRNHNKLIQQKSIRLIQFINMYNLRSDQITFQCPMLRTRLPTAGDMSLSNYGLGEADYQLGFDEKMWGKEVECMEEMGDVGIVYLRERREEFKRVRELEKQERERLEKEKQEKEKSKGFFGKLFSSKSKDKAKEVSVSPAKFTINQSNIRSSVYMPQAKGASDNRMSILENNNSILDKDKNKGKKGKQQIIMDESKVKQFKVQREEKKSQKNKNKKLKQQQEEENKKNKQQSISQILKDLDKYITKDVIQQPKQPKQSAILPSLPPLSIPPSALIPQPPEQPSNPKPVPSPKTPLNQATPQPAPSNADFDPSQMLQQDDCDDLLDQLADVKSVKMNKNMSNIPEVLQQDLESRISAIHQKDGFGSVRSQAVRVSVSDMEKELMDMGNRRSSTRRKGIDSDDEDDNQVKVKDQQKKKKAKSKSKQKPKQKSKPKLKQKQYEEKSKGMKKNKKTFQDTLQDYIQSQKSKILDDSLQQKIQNKKNKNVQQKLKKKITGKQLAISQIIKSDQEAYLSQDLNSYISNSSSNKNSSIIPQKVPSQSISLQPYQQSFVDQINTLSQAPQPPQPDIEITWSLKLQACQLQQHLIMNRLRYRWNKPMEAVQKLRNLHLGAFTRDILDDPRYVWKRPVFNFGAVIQ